MHGAGARIRRHKLPSRWRRCRATDGDDPPQSLCQPCPGECLRVYTYSLMGPVGFQPTTSRLSAGCSSQPKLWAPAVRGVFGFRDFPQNAGRMHRTNRVFLRRAVDLCPVHVSPAPTVVRNPVLEGQVGQLMYRRPAPKPVPPAETWATLCWKMNTSTRKSSDVPLRWAWKAGQRSSHLGGVEYAPGGWSLPEPPRCREAEGGRPSHPPKRGRSRSRLRGCGGITDSPRRAQHPDLGIVGGTLRRPARSHAGGLRVPPGGVDLGCGTPVGRWSNA